MRKLLFSIALLLPFVAFAQYGPPPYPTGASTVGFQPTGKTSAIAASTTTANIALPTAAAQFQVTNPTAGIAFLVFCPTSSCTASVGANGASTSDYPIAAGAVIVVTAPAGTTYAAVILSANSGTVYITPGIGL